MLYVLRICGNKQHRVMDFILENNFESFMENVFKDE